LELLLREGPPGSQQQPEETELQQWFCLLKFEDQEKILKIAKMAVKLTVFNFLVLLDNKMSGQPIQERISDFGLYVHTYGSAVDRFSYNPDESIRLNRSYSVNGDLHEAYDFEINITDDANKIDYKLNFSSLNNLVADNNVVSRIDKGESAEPVLGAVTIFDSLGNSHTLSIKFEHLDNNRWSWKATVPSTSGDLGSNAYGEAIFDPNGQIQSLWQAGGQVTSTPPVPQITFTPASGAEAQFIDLDFGTGTAGVTQTNLTSQVAALSQNGSSSAALSNLNIDQYGNIIGIFSNGNSRNLAQIMVATFSNLNGLVSVGDNMYNVAANAGDPRIDVPGENSVTTIQSGALEQSNVDLSEEFTKMIVSQRGFQANARVVTTADNLLQEITNLIR